MYEAFPFGERTERAKAFSVRVTQRDAHSTGAESVPSECLGQCSGQSLEG